MDNRIITVDPNGNGKRGLPKLRDIFRRQRQDSDGGAESPDLDFVYADADSYTNEIAELYSYTEQSEFQLNVKAFEDLMEMYGLTPCWQKFSLEKKKSTITKLLDQLEVSNKDLRMKAARCFQYLAQGCWAEMQSDKEQQACTKDNVFLLYECGVFHAFVELLNIEIDNLATASTAMRKLAVSLADSTDLRVILSVLYIITETIRCVNEDDPPEWHNVVDMFKNDISHPMGEELLVVKLFGMVTKFCGNSAPHFPMKKVLLLLWKMILVSLGGMSVLQELKKKYREQAGLAVYEEDTIEVVRTMRASSPPASAADLLLLENQTPNQNQRRNNRPFRRSLMKQSSLDESLGMDFDQSDEEMREFDDQQAMEDGGENTRPSSPRPSTPTPAKGLPWLPKVRQRDLDVFLDNTRIKFVGFPLQGDRESLFGLPQPIHESVHILKQHIYTSLAEIQTQQEEDYAKSPISVKEPPISLTASEILYQALLANLPQYMIALLKILLAAAPTSKAKTESINIMADVLPEEMPMTVLQSLKLGTDVNRHKEIVVKAVSAILLLLLKHFKLNHIYQFEFMSQHLVFANCIPLVLKFFNQTIMDFVGAKNVIPILDFPACVIGDQPELTAESLEIGDSQLYCWRNVFSCINLLRILNKLTKWKPSRIMMLVVFKSAPILKRTLKVRHAMMQLYVLKLLKMQTKYLGRQWRKSNMKTMSAIYQKVRHRLNDDWAYGNDLDARPWDFQAEECALRAAVDRFNTRRYSTSSLDPDFEPIDTCITSVLGSLSGIELTEEFKQHYELWLQQEVFQSSTNWDEILHYSYM
ncbi:striatin-interacting protein 1 [Macrosteles quadrilineatus]|uniref:striatin-interacting protein 1 n=1 Tax=Macrosteles quadrilineatus TaxID=74068 RepID=UPI0023E20D50|nr:striatin-interacting protein 1 [Macrosteles quadrilineatus]